MTKTVEVIFENVAPETAALMMGLHPASFDPEGLALVDAILDPGNPRLRNTYGTRVEDKPPNVPDNRKLIE